MKHPATRYKRHRFPRQIIRYAVWLYHRFNLSHRDIEDLLARRGIVVTHESIRLWCDKFGPLYAHSLRRRHRGYGDTFFQASPRRAACACLAYRLLFVVMIWLAHKNPDRSQRFLRLHAAVSSLFNLGRHLVAADHYRTLRRGAFAPWDKAVAI